MIYDLGFARNGGKFDRFWDHYIPEDRQLEFAIFALTPGMPEEFVEQVAGLRRWQLRHSREVVDKFRDQATPLALENAASITIEDGYNMFLPRARTRGYFGAPPHWTSIAFQQMLHAKRPVAEIAKEMRTKPQNIYTWSKSRFDPITMQRVVPRPSKVKRLPYQVTR